MWYVHLTSSPPPPPWRCALPVPPGFQCRSLHGFTARHSRYSTYSTSTADSGYLCVPQLINFLKHACCAQEEGMRNDSQMCDFCDERNRAARLFVRARAGGRSRYVSTTLSSSQGSPVGRSTRMYALSTGTGGLRLVHRESPSPFSAPAMRAPFQARPDDRTLELATRQGRGWATLTHEPCW